MPVRTFTLLLLLPALLASDIACAQSAESQPAADGKSAPAAVAITAATNAQPQALPVPLQSPATAAATGLETAEKSAPLAAAVAGTCTVIDALLMEICAQTPADDYCQR